MYGSGHIALQDEVLGRMSAVEIALYELDSAEAGVRAERGCGL